MLGRIALAVLVFVGVLSTAQESQARRICNVGTEDASIAYITDTDLPHIKGWMDFSPGKCFIEPLGFWAAIAQKDAEGRWGIADYGIPWHRTYFYSSNIRACVDPFEPFHYIIAVWGASCRDGFEMVRFGIYSLKDDMGWLDYNFSRFNIDTSPDVQITPFARALEEEKQVVAEKETAAQDEDLSESSRQTVSTPWLEDLGTIERIVRVLFGGALLGLSFLSAFGVAKSTRTPTLLWGVISAIVGLTVGFMWWLGAGTILFVNGWFVGRSILPGPLVMQVLVAAAMSVLGAALGSSRARKA